MQVKNFGDVMRCPTTTIQVYRGKEKRNTFRMSLDSEFNALSISKHQDNSHILEKYENKIEHGGGFISGKGNKTYKDKSDRATVENVLDPRTMKFLSALTNRGVISEFNGCISSGKEANVYHAFGSEGQELAVKIYKTSILVFKDRERYVDGEFRFRNSRSQHNPRKMIKVWAEKEFRNLRRIDSSGVIPTASPVEVKSNVLVMKFLNRGDGAPSPRLKDYQYQDELEVAHYYYKVIAYMRLLYQVCRLVHADLSEYNIVVHQNVLHIIDVSQSVEPYHPMSLDFLRMDIKNINAYFDKMGVALFQERMIFQFIIAETLEGFQGDCRNANDLVEYLVEHLPIKTITEGADEDEIFRSLHLVRNLGGLEERDFDRFTDGKFDLLKSLIVNDNEKNLQRPQREALENEEDTSVSEDEDEDEGEGKSEVNSENESEDTDESDSEDEKSKPRGKKFEDKDEKKQRKNEAKESKKEKRKTKVKKHVKKKLIKKTKSKK
ncbi:protein kinase rio1 [Zygosaccharomyces mellis]|uniref:Serine/threonine-protein kinase RIO1 n=1 Tax=Zygosaccharomyces mellis TaxID=42258 RepID=A0A4C2E3T6_9SACH|nr:protein kinase rio1 [Zygosaccharomyces mellis]